MSIMPVEALRKSHRNELQLYRKKIKNEENDLHRSLAGLQLADVDPYSLVLNLKNKALVNVTDLRILKNLLIQDKKYIKLVLNTVGALRGLVRELSVKVGAQATLKRPVRWFNKKYLGHPGVDVNRQMEAAECLCNLALADQRGCVTIVQAAGAYIVAALDSHNFDLAKVCAWTLGNLCGSGVVASKMVSRTGAVSKLCALLRSSEYELVVAGCFALSLFAFEMKDELSKKHLDEIVRSAGKSLYGAAFRLIYILSSHHKFSDPQGLVMAQMRTSLHDMMIMHHTRCLSPSCCDLVYMIRTVANIDRTSVYHEFMHYVCQNQDRYKDFMDLFKDHRLKISMLWLFGNMAWRREQERIKKFNFKRVLTITPYHDNFIDNPLVGRGVGLDRFQGVIPLPGDVMYD